MKLRTSLFNFTAFKKDVARFATDWVLYIVALFMILSVVLMDRQEYYRAANLADSLAAMSVINMGFALFNAQLLFGDLFNARHCNALHAMPLRRECWFVTHVVSGLLFALVPNAVMSLVFLPMLGNGAQVALWWFLASGLQYLFFFGVAVFAALCVGSRFAMVLVYGIINFFAVIVYWFFSTMYEPLLDGVVVPQNAFLLWCPAWEMIGNTNFLEVARRTVEMASYNEFYVKSVTLGEGWGYLAICAAIGVVLLAVALDLYRRRKLESAGDFMAVRALEPVFLVLYTLSMAAGFQVFADIFQTHDWVFLILGFIVGFVTGRMLLMRTTKVFQLKGFLWFGVLAAAFGLTLLLTALDPLGVTRYVPDADDIRSVKISNSYYAHDSAYPELTDEEDIALAVRLHEMIVDGQNVSGPDEQYAMTTSFCYTLDNGVTVTRRYSVDCSSPVGELLKPLYSRADFVLGTSDADAFVSRLENLYFDQYKADGQGAHGQLYMNHTNRPWMQGLVEAILADCAEGTMYQNGYRDTEIVAWIEFSLKGPDESPDALTAENGPIVMWYTYKQIQIYEDNRNVLAYLEANPFPMEEVTE